MENVYKFCVEIKASGMTMWTIFSLGECHHNARALGDQPGSDDDVSLADRNRGQKMKFVITLSTAIFLSTK